MIVSHDNLKDISNKLRPLHSQFICNCFCQRILYVARTSRKMFCPKFKYFQVQDGKSFAKVLEIITICSPAVLFKGLFVMFAKSFVYLKGRPILCQTLLLRENPGVFKSNKVVPSQEYCGSLSLNCTFGQNQNLSNFLSGAFQKRYFGFKFNFSF